MPLVAYQTKAKTWWVMVCLSLSWDEGSTRFQTTAAFRFSSNFKVLIQFLGQDSRKLKILIDEKNAYL